VIGPSVRLRVSVPPWCNNYVKLLITLHHRFELWNAPAWLAERLRADFPHLDVVQLPNYDRLTEEIADAKIYVGWSLRAEQLAAAKKLRWIHSTAAAVHQLMIPQLRNSNITVTNARDVHGPVVAEHVIVLILALAKRLPSAMRYQQQAVWAQEQLWREAPPPREIAGGTVLLVGLGSIGHEVAKRGKAFGMYLIAVREHPEKGAGEAHEAYGMHNLDDLLPRTDYVVIVAPLTEATRDLFDAERLAKMRRDAYLINVARGPIVNEGALAQALQRKQIAGAALDVFASEPLPPDSPLWKLENLLITPHTAAVTEKLWERHYVLLRENLQRFLAGKPLLNVVDKRKGY
jgi:phosphoglycerate dehydrogenase-like enzyme